MQFFRHLNGCGAPADRSTLLGNIEVERSAKCAGGSVVLHRVPGGTHASTYAALNVGRMLVEFFSEQKRPPAATLASPATATVAPASTARSTAPASAPRIADINFIAFRFADGSGTATGTFRRISGNQWRLINTRGIDLVVRSTAESEAEINFYDASRDLHLKADMTLKALFGHVGSVPKWETRCKILRADK